MLGSQAGKGGVYTPMPKPRRVSKQTVDEWMLKDEAKLEAEYQKRIRSVQGQLESTKKMTPEEKMHRYNELFSAQQAISSMRHGVMMAMMAEILIAAKDKDYKKIESVGKKLFELLNKRNTD